VHDPRHVGARRVLLDALEALAPHSGALIVAGAQAVYLRTETIELSVAPYTTDGDLTLDPSALEQDPALQDAMRAAGGSSRYTKASAGRAFPRPRAARRGCDRRSHRSPPPLRDSERRCCSVSRRQPDLSGFDTHMEPAASRAARDPIGGVVMALSPDARGSSNELVGRDR
jgi:hypothetical protein